MIVPKTILVVDNDEDARNATTFHLKSKGYQVFATDNPKDALDILSENRIYLAIIDVRLGDDSDKYDAKGLDLAAALGPEIAKIILTGFRTSELTRNAMVGYPSQVPAQDVIEKQDNPKNLLQTVEQVFDKHILDVINVNLDIQYDAGLTLETLTQPLFKSKGVYTPLETQEVEELFCRLFQRESKIRLYHITPGYGGASVALVRPSYRGIEGRPVVVKFGLAHLIDEEISAYEEYVEPFASRYTTVMMGQPVRTHRLAGFKMLFVGHSTDKPRDFNTFYLDKTTTDIQRQKAIQEIFQSSCGIWYQSKRDWQESDSRLVEAMDRQLSLGILSDHSELNDGLNSILRQGPFRHVNFTRENETHLLIHVDGVESELPDPVFFATKQTSSLPQPTFAAITHGDLNGRNIFVDEACSSWLIDFSRTGWGPALRDAAELECTIKFQLLDSANLPQLLEFEHILLSPKTFFEAPTLPTIISSGEFQRAYRTIQAIRSEAYEIVETQHMDEYYATLLFYALKIMTLKNISSFEQRRAPFRQRHALYSAALLAKKFMSPASL